MKKIVALGAIAAIAGGMMFAVPEFAPEVTLDGNATVKWGVDLDAGQHGFTNETGGDFKVKLWGEGTREFEAEDGIWAELKVTGKELKWDGKKEKDERWDGGKWELNEAKLHFNNFYVGIKSGDTQVGEYKFDGAIRSKDNDNAKWLSNVGPSNFSQGITLGYGDDNFGVDVDLRSYYNEDKGKETNTHYTSAYAFAAEAKLKDSNEFVSGLAVDAGIGYNFSDKYTSKAKDEDIKSLPDAKANMLNYYGVDLTELLKTVSPNLFPDTSTQAKAVEEAKKKYEKVKGEVDEGKADLTDLADAANKYKAAQTALKNASVEVKTPAKNVHTLGYAFNASYKFAIDDKYYVKPAVGLTGSNVTGTVTMGKDLPYTSNSNTLVAGVLFGWGDTADSDAGVYFLNDGDQTKKVTPGVSVIAAIPLATKTTLDDKSLESSGAVQALIVPSVYLGSDLVEGLKFAAYGELALLRADGKKEGDKNIKIEAAAANKDRTFAMAFAAGVQYDLKATDDITVSPKAGIRYANTAYTENGINKIAPLSNKPLFEAGYGKMGFGQTKPTNGDVSNFFNLKAGVDVKGFIPNTTIFAEYASANLLNDWEQPDSDKNTEDHLNKYYNWKLGTFDIGCKISF